MTSPAIIQVKTIQALLEAIDIEDEEDAKQVMKMIKALIGEDKKS